jgi:uncharacterized protein YndB with AHSA1/START domain
MATAGANASAHATDGQPTPQGRATQPSPPVGATEPFSWARAASESLPMLAPAASPVGRDRWERLVTMAMIPAPPERIWRALIEPAELRLWLARSERSLERVGDDTVLDFEDGEFFLVRTQSLSAPAADNEHRGELRWMWRWLGIGQPALVTWRLDPGPGGVTTVTATEEAVNPPADWQTWNGGGWPGILDQLAAYLRTGTEWRWPWRRMGPYVQVELASSPFEAWDTLMSPSALKFWMQRMSGDVTLGSSVVLMMGDASGTVELAVREVVDAGQQAPSFLPHVDFALRRGSWGGELGGRLWIEPAGLGRSLLQVFHYGWESLPPSPGLLEERKVLTSFWAGAARRAVQLFMRREAMPGGPHGWT